MSQPPRGGWVSEATIAGVLLALSLFGLLSSLASAADNRNLAVSATERRVALVIGNGAYKESPLKNPANDAEDIAAVLKTLGFEVISRRNANQRDMKAAVREFGQKLRGAETGLFYYAGHGVQVRGVNYLMPIAVDIESEADAEDQAVSLDYVLRTMEESGAKFNVSILDACRNNPFARSFRSASRGLASAQAPSGMLIAYSTAPGSIASDGEGRNGIYTKHLLRNLREGDSDILKVFQRVRTNVVKETGGKQTPWESTSLVGEFFFRPGQGTQVASLAPVASTPSIESAAPATPSRPVTTYSTSTSRPEDSETQMWNEVKSSGAREYFDAYLKQYPKGKYVALARVEIKKIDDMARADQARAEQDAWEGAKSGGSPAAYAGYLESYPKGRYALLAQAGQQKAQREAADQERQEAARLKQQQAETAQREEADLWQRVESAKDSVTVQRYIDRYPAGRHITLARARLDVVKKEEAEMKPGKVFQDCADCPEMVIIPAGSFQMGGSGTDERPVHAVTIAKPFAMGKTEVTQGQWRAVMGYNPSSFLTCGDTCPVEKVSWDDAQDFIRKLNAKTGKTYRLPFEAEWEYACRAGGRDEYCGGGNVDSVAWYVSNSGSKTHAVAGKQANAWGLYDMSGNIWEWTEDCWNDSYNGAPSDGSAWTSGNCGRRVLRGGSWDSRPQDARSAKRDWNGTSVRGNFNGFRLARMLP